jgi:hypothetical protein
VSQDPPLPTSLDTSACGPGADRCLPARTAPNVVIRCERHFLAALSGPATADGAAGTLPLVALGDGIDLLSAS